MTRRRIAPAIAGVLAATLSWVMGVVLADAVLVGLLFAALVAMPMWLGYPGGRDFSAEPPDNGGQRGYYEVRRIAGMFGRDSGSDPFSRLIAPRLRLVAERRLGAAGLRWRDGATRDRLGADVFDWLDGRPSPLDSRSRVAQTELVLDRLDTLNEEAGNT